MIEPVWVNRRVLLLCMPKAWPSSAGRQGVRNEGLFESALERARMRWTYEPESSIPELAAPA